MSVVRLTSGDLTISYSIDLSSVEPDGSNFIAQTRIELALKKLSRLKSPDYNCYISGNLSKGDKLVVKSVLMRHLSGTKKERRDYCYVNNFLNPRMPKLLVLPAGKGIELSRSMEELVKYLKKNVPAIFESKEYEKRIQAVISEYAEKEKALYEELEEKANEMEFIVKPSPTGILINPVVDGKIVTEREYDTLPQETKKAIEERRKKLEEHINTFLRKTREIEKEKHEQINKINDEMGLFVVAHKIDEMKEKFDGIDCVQKYLDEVESYTLDNISIFLPQKQQMFPFLQQENKYTEYKVNVLVDSLDSESVPIIYEENPTYYNVFGKVEKQAYFGAFVANFTNIVAGAIHKANGGYLILDAVSVLSNPGVWETLKKTLVSRKATIEDLGEKYGFIASETLKPEPMDVDVNVVLIGPEWVYRILFEYDEEFGKLFKLKTNFDASVDAEEESLEKYASRVLSFCKEAGLKKPDTGGFKALFEYSSRMASHKRKLWAYTDDVFDILREAHFASDGMYLGYNDIKKAIDEKVFLRNIWKEKIYELVKTGQILIELDGKRVGQVNGLSVIDLGDFSFGQPNRITAKVFAGNKGILNVERESKLSGRIFDKASYIMMGYLGYMYAFDMPISLSATISFDQSYSVIEGDSASIAETLALLSAIADIPIRQDLAVTGSMDQNGRVQPIGGVNEKIEGFYEVCKLTGRLGSSGVVIPKNNLDNLVLSDDVKCSVEKGEFHIYTVEDIDDAIELFSGIRSGRRVKNRFEKGTFHYFVKKKLMQLTRIADKNAGGRIETEVC